MGPRGSFHLVAGLTLVCLLPARTRAAEPTSGPDNRPRLVVQMGADRVTSAAFSPDGKFVLTGTGEGPLLWDIKSGKEIGAFKRRSVSSAAVAFSPDGAHVLTGNTDTTARLWDVASGREVRDLMGHTGPVSSVAFSSDGKYVLTGSLDKTARLWEAASGKSLCEFIGHTDQVTSVAISRDGKRVLTGSKDKSARLWDAASGKSLREFTMPESAPVKPKDAKSTPAFTGWPPYVESVAFSPDGKQVLTGSWDKTARLWDSQSGSLVRTFTIAEPAPSPAGKMEPSRIQFGFGLGAPVTKVLIAFSPDGAQVLGGGPNGLLRLWDAKSGKELQAFTGHTNWIDSVAFSRNGTQVLASSYATTRLWDVKSGKELRAFAAQTDVIHAAAFSRDGKRILIGGQNGSLRVWDVASGKQTRDFAVGARIVHEWSFAPDGMLAWADMSHLLGSPINVWDVSSGKIVHAIKDPGLKGPMIMPRVVALAFSPDGKRILTGQDDKKVRLRDVQSGTTLHTFAGHTNGVNAVAFSPDGKRALTGSYDKTARLWDLESGKQLHLFEAHAAAAFAGVAVAFSPDGSQAATCAADKMVRFWDVRTGKQMRVWAAHANPVNSLAFSPDGKQVLTTSRYVDDKARLWDVPSGAEVRVFAGHDNLVRSAAFSPDGKQVVTASSDGTVRLWDARTGQELCKFIAFTDGSWAVFTPENHYLASTGVLKGLAFRVGQRMFSFDQFDLKFNRPDKVVERIGLAAPEVTAAYRQAYQKRLKRMNFTEAMLGADFQLPEVAVPTNLPQATRARSIKFKVRASDAGHLLDRLNIYVNGVPAHGVAGIDLRGKKVRTWEQDVDIELGAGKNTIQVSALNEKGAESLRETLEIVCEAPEIKPDLYVVVVGVSAYQDQRFRLTYADKDAKDLADYLASLKNFRQARVLRLVNQDATRDKILTAKQLLSEARVDDQVIVFFSGHGLLDSELDYYFATVDMDFTHPAAKGVSYEAIEGLLSGIRARKKLLLMDTCHSGEVDRDEPAELVATQFVEGEVKGRAVRGLQRKLQDRPLGLKNSLRLQEELFADLRRGSGAVVISAAGGMEFALESREWNNGVFTYALLRGLKDNQADLNKDGQVQVSELRKYVTDEVRRLTGDRQSPTTRMENLDFDYPIVAQPAIKALTGADMVGVWRHQPGKNKTQEIKLLPNGRINNPNGPHTWTFSGTALVLRWANAQAPGGFWVDTCSVSPDGKTYRGSNQTNVVISGEKVGDGK